MPETERHPERHVERHPERNLVHRLWPRFADDLREALAIAYNDARREGKTRISTRRFFAAVEWMQPPALRPLLGRLPEGALPRMHTEQVDRSARLLEEDPQLSTCIERTLTELAEAASVERLVNVTDAFVDLAKHGQGPSTARLVERGVDARRVEQLVNELEISVLRRRHRD